MDASNDHPLDEQVVQSKLSKLKYELLQQVRLENEHHQKRILEQKKARRKLQRKKEKKPSDVINTDTEDLESDSEDVTDGKYETMTRLRLHFVRKLVKRSMHFQEPHDCLPLKDKMSISYDSDACLSRAIRSSILKGDWNNVTHLLLILSKNLDTPQRRQLFKTVCRLNFKHNSAGRDINIWKNYLNLMNVSSVSQV